MKDLTDRAMNDLNNHKQKDLVVDILEIYFVEHVKKVTDNAAADDYFVNLCNFVHFLSVNKFKSKQEFKADVPSAEVKKKASAAALSVVNSEPKIERLAMVVAKKESSEDLLTDDNNAT